MKKIIFIFISLTMGSVSSTCSNVFKVLDKEVKQYTRIIDHINEYHATCNVVYAYSIFLHNPTEMNALENDNVYAEHLGEFVKNYPYFSQLILNKKTFERFYKLTSPDKKLIDDAIKHAFCPKELKNKKNIVYLTFSLSVVGEHFSSKNLSNTIKYIKQKYTFEEMPTIIVFWNIYRQQYVEKSLSPEKLFASFEEAVEIYGIHTLKRYEDYAADFYPVLISKVENNKLYMSTIKSLLHEIKYTTNERQAYFLKNISLDIQIALANGNTKKEIIHYFRAFIKKKFILQFGSLSCFEKQGLAMLVSDHLDEKLDWSRDNKDIFPDLIRLLSKQESKEKMINVLGLYNYAGIVYAKMKTSQQKEMFENIVNLPTGDLLFNLSLIYTLGSNTTYISMIINNPNFMYEGNKYKEIFYVNRDGKMILNLFRDQDGQFIPEINELVTMSYEDIHDMTTSEKIDLAFEVVDYASYATMIIPGAGIAVQIGKTLAKTSIKKAVKIGMKKSVKNTLKVMKEQAKDYWKDAVKYTGKKTRDKTINKNILRSDQILTGVTLGGFAYHYFFNKKEKQLCTGVE